jgi:alpha-N-acetylglucosaminidase
MNGINLPLAFTGQELIWQRVFNRLGVSNESLQGDTARAPLRA